MDDLFLDAARSRGDLAGVFESDGDTCYFYLYQTVPGARKVLGAIHVASGQPTFSAESLEIRWNTVEDKVGLFIHGQLWAVFDARSGAKYGGGYRVGATPNVPSAVKASFASH